MSSVCPSVTLRITAKRHYPTASLKCLNKWIGNAPRNTILPRSTLTRPTPTLSPQIPYSLNVIELLFYCQSDLDMIKRCCFCWIPDKQKYPWSANCSASSVDRCVHSLMSSLQALRRLPLPRVPSAIPVMMHFSKFSPSFLMIWPKYLSFLATTEFHNVFLVLLLIYPRFVFWLSMAHA